MKRTHPLIYRPNDRVSYLYDPGSQLTRYGTFIMYCPGYLSHCMVQWDGVSMPTRVAVAKLTLVSGGPWGSEEDRKNV